MYSIYASGILHMRERFGLKVERCQMECITAHLVSIGTGFSMFKYHSDNK